MAAKKKTVQPDHSTEEKIKRAAQKLFTKKGYAATKTRDIAAEAGINIALLNYYFRSKEKLFDIIMLEHLQGFVQSMSNVLNDNATLLDQKIETFVSNYIDLLIQQPDIPLFILSELRAHPKELIQKLDVKKMLVNSSFAKQLVEAMQHGKMTSMHPLHFIMNIAGLVVFPFVGAPILVNVGNLKQREFEALMLERKKLIPVWIKAMTKAK